MRIDRFGMWRRWVAAFVLASSGSASGSALGQDVMMGSVDGSSPVADRITDRGAFGLACGASALVANDSVNDGVPYEVLYFETMQEELLGLSVRSLEPTPIDFDPFVQVYCVGYNPNDSAFNLIGVDDDGGGYPTAAIEPGDVVPVFPGNRYALVVSAYSTYQNGSTNAGEGSFVAELFGNAQFVELCLADLNGDGMLNGADFNAWLTAFQAGSSLADQNGDGMLNGADFNAWLQNFMMGCP